MRKRTHSQDRCDSLSDRADERRCAERLGGAPAAGQGHDSASTAALSREHMVELHSTGMITVTGGKWTTYRHMAQEVIDLAVAKGILPAAACCTDALPLHGEVGFSGDGGYYGTDESVVAQLPGASNVLVEASGLTEAQVRLRPEAELARCVEDVLARRNRALFLDAAAARRAAPEVARVMAEVLGFGERWQREQVRGLRCLRGVGVGVRGGFLLGFVLEFLWGRP